MYKIFELSDKIRVPPHKFGLGRKRGVKESLEEKLEGSIEENIGVILAVVDVKDIGEGKIVPGDGALYFPVSFSVMSYLPERHEVIKGEVIDVTEFGVFVRMGPVDGMVHVSQLMDDFVSYDSKNLMFTGKKSNRRVKEDSILLARVISISKAGDQYKIGLTTRQPGLGSIEWLEQKRRERKESPKTKGKDAAPKKRKGKK